MTKAEARARKIISMQSLDKLIEQFELTETNNDPYIPTVRGWLMDELESRDPDAFDTWLESEEDSPRKFFI